LGVRIEDDVRQSGGVQIVAERRKVLEEDTKEFGHVL
jgi:hypothetical protein